MTYQSRLYPWLVCRQLPNLQTIPVARFRRRGNAEMYLATVKRLIPNGQFTIAFDATTPETPDAMPDPHRDRSPPLAILSSTRNLSPEAR